MFKSYYTFFAFFLCVCSHASDITQYFTNTLQKSYHERIQSLHDNALSTLRTGKLEQLDGPGGDNACHIRTAMMADYYETNQALSQQAYNTIDIGYILHHISQQSQSSGYDIRPCKQAFASIVCGKEDVSRAQFENSIKSLQKAIASNSVNYIQTIAHQMKPILDTYQLDPHDQSKVPYGQQIQKALSVVTGGKTPSTACFPTIVTLLYHTKQKQRPIICRIHKNYGSDNPYIVYEHPNGTVNTSAPQNNVTPAFVVDAISTAFPHTYRAAYFTSNGISSGILANAAHHPQFTGNVPDNRLDLSSIPTLRNMYLYYRSHADTYGFKQQDARSFAIYHIFPALTCTTIANTERE